MSKFLAIIPARGGSKGVPRKNIKLLAGKPLIAYTIEVAKRSKLIDRFIVSSDDDEIIAVAKSLGAEVPFTRPSELALDHIGDRPVLQHAINKLKELDNYHPDFVITLRPTTPFRTEDDINELIRIWESKNSDSVRSVTEVEGVHHPYWMFEKDENGYATPLIEDKTIDVYYRRQLLPPVYRLNGVVDGIKTEVILHHEKYYGSKMALAVTPPERSYDIDTIEDFEYAEYLMQKIHVS